MKLAPPCSRGLPGSPEFPEFRAAQCDCGASALAELVLVGGRFLFLSTPLLWASAFSGCLVQLHLCPSSSLSLHIPLGLLGRSACLYCLSAPRPQSQEAGACLPAPSPKPMAHHTLSRFSVNNGDFRIPLLFSETLLHLKFTLFIEYVFIFFKSFFKNRLEA